VTVVTGQPHGRANGRRLSTHYAAGLVLAHIIALTQSAAILIPLSGHTTSGAQAYLTLHNVILAVALAVLGTIVTAVGALVNLAPTLRWYVAGSEPGPGQRRAALSLITRQSAMLAATWAAAGTIFILLNRNGGLGFAVPCLLGIAVGASAAAGTGLLLTQRTLRPVIIAATAGSGEGVTAPGVLARLVVMWLLSGGLPLGVIAVIVIIQPRGWIIENRAGWYSGAGGFACGGGLGITYHDSYISIDIRSGLRGRRCHGRRRTRATGDLRRGVRAL